MALENAEMELSVFQQIISGLSKLEKEDQSRLLQSVVTFLNLESLSPSSSKMNPTNELIRQEAPQHSFIQEQEILPKQFLLEKEPHLDIERVACLAYYLTHYRNHAHFKTLDISKINTEAAQQKFTNAAQTLKNATSRGLIVPVSRGLKQLSALGEQFVEALPDRNAAKIILNKTKTRRSRKNPQKKTAQEKRPEVQYE